MSDKYKLNYSWNNMHLNKEPVMAIAAMQSKALNLRTFAQRSDYNTTTMRAELEDMSKILGKVIQDVKAIINSEWQPIESAPRDGRPFIGYSPANGVLCDVMWSFEREDFDLNGWSCCARDWTHWMPQSKPPQPPKDKEA